MMNSSLYKTHLKAMERHLPYGITWHRWMCPQLRKSQPDGPVLDVPTRGM